MESKNIAQMNFFSEMSERQMSASEFFSTVLLESLERHFHLKKVMIAYFDTQGRFLSWVKKEGLLLDSEAHPYHTFVARDIIRQMVFQDAVRDRLTYFNVIPRLYKATDLIDPIDYDSSAYVRFLEEHFKAHYSVTMAFGINAYIQVVFFKSQEEGDFTSEEIDELHKIYIYVSNSYKNFKKHEQAKIVSSIQSEIIALGEKSYMIADEFMHVMSYNQSAQECIKDILGPTAANQMNSTSPCSWLHFLLGDEQDATGPDNMRIREIKDYIFKIHIHDQSYSNGIVDRYHWITICHKTDQCDELTKQQVSEVCKEQPKQVRFKANGSSPLTQAEQRVAELMYQGLTYRAIADELVISYHTVKKHVQNIYTRCGVNSRYELYKWIEENAQ